MSQEDSGDIIKENVIADFTGVKDFGDIQKRFFKVARSIMFDHKVTYGQKCFKITSLELYLKLHKQREIWCDPTTDKDAGAEEQFNQATWYVRQKKGPAFWRIDITAGCKLSGIQAGMLIRQLNRDGGPAKAIHAIVRGDFGRHSWTQEERERIQEIHGKFIDGSDGSTLKLVKRSTPIEGELWKGVRIGLSKREPDARNCEGILIREAALRIATWKMKPKDEKID